MAKYNYNFDILEKESPEKYYFLGFLAADAYISDKGINFELNIKDRYMVENLEIISVQRSLYIIMKKQIL